MSPVLVVVSISAAIVSVAIVIAVAAWAFVKKRRTQRLRTQFAYLEANSTIRTCGSGERYSRKHCKSPVRSLKRSKLRTKRESRTAI
jgi:hypothetical protein